MRLAGIAAGYGRGERRTCVAMAKLIVETMTSERELGSGSLELLCP